MKNSLTALSMISMLLLAAALVCGLWIGNQGDQVADLERLVSIHKMLGIGGVVITIITLRLAIPRKRITGF